MNRGVQVGGRARRLKVNRAAWCERCHDLPWNVVQGEVCGRGHAETTGPALESLVRQLSADDKLRVGQEVGRMIASSRKKTDRRGACRIARALQRGPLLRPA
jgi:hypothetical protein